MSKTLYIYIIWFILIVLLIILFIYFNCPLFFFFYFFYYFFLHSRITSLLLSLSLSSPPIFSFFSLWLRRTFLFRRLLRAARVPRWSSELGHPDLGLRQRRTTPEFSKTLSQIARTFLCRSIFPAILPIADLPSARPS